MKFFTLVLLLVCTSWYIPGGIALADEEHDYKLIEAALFTGYMKAQAERMIEAYHKGLAGQDQALLAADMANFQIKQYNQLLNDTFTNQTKLKKMRLPEISI